MAFILKLYSIFAASCMLLIIFTCQQEGVIVAALSFTAGAVLLFSFTGPKATYSQDAEGRYFATFTYKGIQYRETADGCQLFAGGGWLPVGVCPAPSIANKVRGMNQKSDKSTVATVVMLVLAIVVMAPALFASVLSTPAIVSQLSGMATIMSIGLVTLFAIAIIAVAIWLIGGVRAKWETGPLSVQLEAMELPEFAPNNKDFDIGGPVDGETPEQYTKRAKAALDVGANLTIVAPKGSPVWFVKTPAVEATVNRVSGDKDLGIDPVLCPQIECEAEYKRNLGAFFGGCLAYFGTNNRIAERIANSNDPAADVLAQVGTFCFALFFALPVFAQNNSAQALDYLGGNYEKVKPSGAVAFHYAKLSIKVQGDAQKTFSDLLTHSAGFDDAGKWGALQVVTVDGMAIARQAKAAPVAAKDEKPKGEGIRPIADKAGETMSTMKSYFNGEVTKDRVKEREKWQQQLSAEYGENMRIDAESIAKIPFTFLKWPVLIIICLLWIIAKSSAGESAILKNGLVIMGRLQNWMHDWSSGILCLLLIMVCCCGFVWVCIAYIMRYNDALFQTVATVCAAALAYKAIKWLTPNKQVLAGGNNNQDVTPYQR